MAKHPTLPRRAFLQAIGTAAIAGGIARANAAPMRQDASRRRVSLGGRRLRVIDAHAHCVIVVEDLLAGTPLAGQGGATAPGTVLTDERLRVMDQQGVDIQALSINFYWWYAADRTLAERIVRAQNEGLAAWVRAHPDRFVGLASVALQHPELAADQLEEGVTRLGLRGASIGGHVNGEDPSLPKYDPFWARAAKLGVPVFMHPNGAANIVKNGALAGRADLGNIIGNPLETTYFLSRMIFDGALDRHPGLRIIAAHAGGYLPSYAGRSEYACQRPNANCQNRKPLREYLRTQVVVDSMVFSDEGLRHLVAEVGASQVVYGTDVPYVWPVGVDLVLNASFLTDQEKEAILGGTLASLLRVT